MKSRYLKIPSKPRFTDNEPINQRRRNLWFLEECFFFPAVQSTSVEIISNIRCHPDANQKKAYEHSNRILICFDLLFYMT